MAPAPSISNLFYVMFTTRHTDRRSRAECVCPSGLSFAGRLSCSCASFHSITAAIPLESVTLALMDNQSRTTDAHPSRTLPASKSLAHPGVSERLEIDRRGQVRKSVRLMTFLASSDPSFGRRSCRWFNDDYSCVAQQQQINLFIVSTVAY